MGVNAASAECSYISQRVYIADENRRLVHARRIGDAAT
jgi:hypothetical protein